MRVKFCGWIVVSWLGAMAALAEEPVDAGLNNSLANIYRTSDAESRSISAENFTGERGKAAMAAEGVSKDLARNLGRGWKISPGIKLNAGTSFTLGDVQGSGAIQHIFMTPYGGSWRMLVLRFYWDGETSPSVEVPLGDFFGMGWGEYAAINSLTVAVNPGSAFNSYWVMPFRKKFRITIENLAAKEMWLWYQIDYSLAPVPNDAAYFHAQFRRVNPTKPRDVYTIVDGIRGKGQYVGTYMAYAIRRPGWWGEGEIKFYMDGDKEFPSVAGTGTEDYFGGSFDFINTRTRQYQEFTHSYSGLIQVLRPEDQDEPTRFGLYRWHISDPIRFKKELRVTIQALGSYRQNASSEYAFVPLQEDIASVAYWYQTEPHAPFPKLPSKEQLSVDASQ